MKINLSAVRNINKTWAVLGVSLAIGVFAALATRNYLSTRVEAIEARGKHSTVDIVVAKNDIEKGSMVSNQNLALRKIPVEFAHSGAIRPEDFPRVDGSVIAFPVKSGEMMMWSQMENKRAPTFSARLLAGRRAITVVVDEINSISGMLEPGDLIDLMFTADQRGKKVIAPLLQSVQILATGQRSVDDVKSGERVQFATVTLNTTPEQAKNIIVAREIGKLTALLRNPADSELTADKLFDLATFLASTEQAPHVSSRREIPVLYGGNIATLSKQALSLNRQPGVAAPGASATSNAPP